MELGAGGRATQGRLEDYCGTQPQRVPCEVVDVLLSFLLAWSGCLKMTNSFAMHSRCVSRNGEFENFTNDLPCHVSCNSVMLGQVRFVAPSLRCFDLYVPFMV